MIDGTWNKQPNKNTQKQGSKKGITWVELAGNAAQIVTNLDGAIVSWNSGAQSLLGYSAAESIGQPISLILPSERLGGSRPSSDRIKPRQRVERFKALRVRKDGTAIHVLITQSPVENERGQLCGFSSIYREIAASKQTSPVMPAKAPTERRTAKVIQPGPRKVLLSSAAAAGTIAAVRNLGAHGIEVGVITGPHLSPAAWSRNAARSYTAPPETEIERFLERLLAIGASNPGQVLLPTSDETAWLYTLNSGLLEQHFRLYQPSIESMRRILDKKLFADAVARAGLSVLPTWEPRCFEDVVALASSLPYPVLIKPRTHVHRLMNDKGVVAHSISELLQQYQRFVDRERFQEAEGSLVPNAGLPILQQFVSVANEGVCSVTGFIDRTGELFVTRRSTKVFQRSQPVGVGVCFEALPDAPALSGAVRRLCRELDYFGIFEVEFLRFDGGWAAIDFNARMFNQIGMDVRRGMPLPLLAYLDASGDTASLREAVAQAQAGDADPKTVFCDGFTLRAILFARTITGRISRDERDYWRAWAKRNAAHTVDFAAAEDDPMPAVIHALSDMYLGVRAIRKFLHSMPRITPVLTSEQVSVKAKA